MGKIFHIFFAILIISAIFSPVIAESSLKTEVKTILFAEEDGADYVQIRLSSKVNPIIFQLSGEKPRIVCDLPDTGYPAKMAKVFPLPGDLVQRIRIGIHQQPEAKTRIVIDLNKDAQYTTFQELREKDNWLILRITEKNTEKTEVSTDTTSKQQNDAEPEFEAAPAGKPSEPPMSDDDTDKNKKQQTGEDKVGASSEIKGEQGTILGQKSTPEDEEEVAELLAVSFESSTNDKEMVLFKLNGFHPPVVFAAGDQDLLVVCDFLDTLLGEGIEPVLEANGKYISKIRTTEQRDPGKVRVVLDLADDFNYDLKQVFFQDDNLFVVVISNLGEKK